MFVALALSLALAQAQTDFQRTFEPASVARYVEGRDSVIVVAAGAPSAALADAAAALEAALRASGKLQLVLNGKTFGDDASALDDASIIKRCSPLPVSAVMVVRVFEAAGQPARAVATIYDKQGALATAFAAAAGAPLSAATARGAAAPSAGVDGETARAVLETRTRPSAAAQREYDENYIGFTQSFARLEPTLGKFSRELDYAQFYKMVGRPELIDGYESRRAVRTGLLVATATLAVASPIFAIVAARASPPLITADSAQLIGTLGFTTGALLFMLPLLYMNPHPLDNGEMVQLADAYNQALKVRLGLVPPASASASSAGPSVRVSFDAVTLPGGGGVRLAARF